MTTDELLAKFEAWWKENYWYVDEKLASLKHYAWMGWLAAHASRDAEVEALRKDAERYHALRLAAICENNSFIERMILGVPAKDCTESQFDEAIDAAMREESK